MSQSERLLRHVVLFQFTNETSPAQIKSIEEAFCALPEQIDVIHDFEWGVNVSIENAAQGFTHCFLLTFRSEADRAIYLPHPAHRAFGDLLRPFKEKVLVIDYWTTDD